ncbi:MAG: 16S rRNA (adenine(1518)-N(6)/adenine(1519)-N(6))-dimethyltransferase RsmA [Aquificae bacterium]|nr:16S rRNA (adenine(1518)-N(6)/adenine(1519)-N(6))-dimethyltransferase RsmA [Aquificota bacterium]
MKKFRTKKHLGQHILISQGVLEKIADELQIEPTDIIVEIGVGTGQLTEVLLNKAPKILYGIEVDKTAYPIIKERFKDYKNFILVEQDFLALDLYQLVNHQKIKLVGNLPYNIGALILIKTVEHKDLIKTAVFMLQKEVAQKLIAKPKTKQYSFLSVFVQTFFDVRYVMSVPSRFFKPPPKVVSAVVKLVPKENVPIKDIRNYQEFLTTLFTNRRKMLKSKIDTQILQKANIKETSRVEELTIQDFIKLYSLGKQGEKP